MKKCNKIKASIIFAALIMATGPIYSAEVDDLDVEAQRYFNEKEYSRALALWLNILDVEPDNEKIQQKIEMVYEIKQKKDLAYQKSRLFYRIARKKLYREEDEEIEEGIARGKSAIDEFVIAYRIDPKDPETTGMVDDMKRLEEEIKAAEERIRLSLAKRAKVKALKEEATEIMKSADPDYQAALNLWEKVLSYVPQDSDALEGKRKCTLAIENRLKYENIRNLTIRGKDYFNRKEYKLAKREFTQVLDIDPKNKEARDYIENINEIIEETMLTEQRMRQAEEFYQSGINNARMNNFDQAEEDFESTLALVKDYKDAPQRLRDISRLRKEYEEMVKRRKLQKIYENFQEGVIAYSEGRYREAVAAFVATLSVDSKNERAKEYLVRAREALRLEEEEIVDQNSPYFDIVNSLVISGKSLYQKGQFMESKQKWDNILKLFPKHRIAKEYIIKCDMSINPQGKGQLLETQIAQGRDYMKKKDYRSALRTFNVIRSVDPRYPGIDGLIADAQNALKAEKTEQVKPEDRTEINRRYRIAMDLYQRGGRDNIQRALNEFRWVVRKDPGNVKAVITVNKIEAQLRIGTQDYATESKLTAKQQMLVKKYYYSGINYYTNNNFQMALQEWRKVLAIDPGNVKARNNIRKVLAFLGR